MPEKSIGDEAFYGCGITTLTLPKGVKQVGKEAFMKCRKLTKVNFADDYQVISQEMFAECSSLEEITFSSSIEGMNSMAFYCCPLKKVVIPSTIKYMPWDAFLYCQKLTEFVILDSDEELGVWNADDDEDLTKLKTLYLGRNLNYIDNSIMTHLYPSQLSIGPKVTNIPKIFGDGIQEITSYIVDPTSVPENFSNKVKANATLKVRPNSYDAYCNAPGWKDFFFIEKFTEGETYIGIAIDEKNFPDPVFRQYVIDNFDKNHNGGFSVDEAALVTKLDMDGMGITNLKGIEYFTALTELKCSNNKLSSLDVSKNKALEYLVCGRNQLASLDVSKNTALTLLNCRNNKLTSLDVSKNIALEYLACGENQLASLDVSKNTALMELYCYNNNLTLFDVSMNTALEYLVCDENQLTSLDVSKNIALEYLACGGNQLASLDVSKNTALMELYCGNNKLTALDLSKNTALIKLQCYQNLINETEMGKLVESLPTWPTFIGSFYVKKLSDANELNVITTTQAAAAKAKGWYVYALHGLTWSLYDGETSGIETVGSGQPTGTDIPVFNMNGQRVNTPGKGVYIKNGRKVLMK